MSCLCCSMRFFKNGKYDINASSEIAGSSQPATSHNLDNINHARISKEQITSLPSTSQTNDEPPMEKTAENEPKVERRQGVPAQPMKVEENFEDIKIPKYDKDKSAENLIKSSLMDNEFLRNSLDDERLQQVVDAMYMKKFNTNEFVIKEGETGAHLYVSEDGLFEITKGEMFIKHFKGGETFGELALLYDMKRFASIQALTNAKVWTLDRNIYQKIMLRTAIEEQKSYIDFLRNVPKLNEANESVLNSVSNLFKKEFFATGTIIVRQGDKGDKFYIIKAGSVLVTKRSSENGIEETVGILHKGEYFGELALLQEDCRQASCIAQAPGVECLTLDRNNFIKNFGDIDALDYSTDTKPPPPMKQQKSQYQHIVLDDLDVVSTLGVGGFGRVELVQYRKDKSLTFALKYLKKMDMVQMQQQEHVYNEKMIMMGCDSMFIIKMFQTFRDEKYLYFLMEPCLGGDVWTMLQKARNRCFDEKVARFMAACVTEALAYLHARDIIYRDLKPENILVDNEGYIKLVDFGFAKILGPRGRTYTFAGTPEYVAPEIILNRGHDRAVDYWALGIFIHELLIGKPPFRGSDHMKTYNLIIRGIDNVEFSPRIPKAAGYLIRKLCRTVPSDRLGCQKNGVDDIKNAKWFLGFEWEQLETRQMPAPIKINLKNNLDTSYFDKYPKDTEIPPDDQSGWDADF